ncbi:Thioesterase, partial [Pyrenophora tritici-repentis]
MARHYVSLIQKDTPKGAIILGGWCIGGLIAIQLAHELQGQTTLAVHGVILIDTFHPRGLKPEDDRLAYPGVASISNPTTRDMIAKSMERAFDLVQDFVSPLWEAPDANIPSRKNMKSPVKILLRAKGKDDSKSSFVLKVEEIRQNRYLGWELEQSNFFTKLLEVEGSHYTMFDQEN